MAVNNIKYVTQAIITFLEEGFKIYYPPGGKNVFPDPPSKPKENGIGFYLFHIQESAHHKNFPPPGKDMPPVRFSPMGLNLYYQLTVNFDNQNNDGTDAYEEQEMLGIAMKLLHDYPEINDQTTINGTNIFDAVDTAAPPFGIKMRENRIKISLLPVTHNESVHYWTAGQSPMKLSAYYEVSLIFLEPEAPSSYAGRVLQYGTFIFTEGTPRITGSLNKLSFTTPPPASEPREVIAQPAQAPFGNTIELQGTGFSGDEVEVVLFSAKWDSPCIADSSWNPTVSGGNKITLTIQEQAVIRGSDPVATRDVLPGIYSAQVNVIRRRTLPNGRTRTFDNSSNQFPFTITPFISAVAGPVGGIVTMSGHLFQHADLPPNDVVVFVGETRLNREPTATLSPGTFRTPSAGILELRLPSSGLNPGDVLPLRILISGAESPPRWIIIP